MKVNSLYPIIVSENPQETIEFYKTLGFEIKHDVTTKMGSHVYVISNGAQEFEVMEKAANAPMPMPCGLYGLRMNVDDIDEAYNELKAKGCTMVTSIFDTENGKNLLIKDSQGVNITVMQHIKK